jgi:pyridoxamine 5'-phosphate oxidase
MVDFATNSLLSFNRTNFKKGSFDEKSADKNPFDQFDSWLNEAFDIDKDYANAMVLSTVDADLMPDSRVVLLRNVSSGGFTFFTNYHSKKGKDINTNPNASLLFFWKELERQVRIQGKLEFLPSIISDNYFESRPFESKVGAQISDQSAVVKNRNVIDKLFNNALQVYESQEVPRPKHWGGYVLIPSRFEFWQGRSNRLHDRLQYILDNKGEWVIQRLMP